jgi:amidase
MTAISASPVTEPAVPDLIELTDRLRTGAASSTELTTWCLDRIAALNPAVHAVLALDPTALAQAEQADARRASDTARGPLDGVPVLVKDSIDTAGLATTAGSRVLSTPPREDAAIVTTLRDCGAVLLGKTNLSEWGNFRSPAATEGWSAVGGQTQNPYRIGYSPSGSSAGSAVAVATGMAPLAFGTETDGSIVGPAGANGVVGVKPETGLLPTRGIVPISAAQDVVGVFTRSTTDASVALAALTGGRPSAPAPLRGRRLGVWPVPGMPSMALTAAGAALTAAGARLVPVEFDEEAGHELLVCELLALYAEFRPSLEGYLAGRPGAPRSLPDLAAAHRNDPQETRLFGLEIFDRAAAISDEERRAAVTAGRAARSRARELVAGTLSRHNIDAVLAPSNPPAWKIDHSAGDPASPVSSTLAALAGLPSVSLPAAFDAGLPCGVSVFGPRQLARLWPVAAAIDRACAASRPPTLLAAPAAGRDDQRPLSDR